MDINNDKLEMAIAKMLAMQSEEMEEVWKKAIDVKDYKSMIEDDSHWLIGRANGGEDLRSLIGVISLKSLIIGMIINEDNKDVLELKRLFDLSQK